VKIISSFYFSYQLSKSGVLAAIVTALHKDIENEEDNKNPDALTPEERLSRRLMAIMILSQLMEGTAPGLFQTGGNCLIFPFSSTTSLFFTGQGSVEGTASRANVEEVFRLDGIKIFSLVLSSIYHFQCLSHSSSI
jgi:hypothetical protein